MKFSSLRTMAKRFHTTMVLTQHYWSMRDRMTSLFPYHYGSHASGCKFDIPKGLDKFPYHYGSHATWKMSKPRKFRKRVSIPLWFSRNLKFMVWRDPIIKFPYHYGSHATSGRRAEKYRYDQVSIPLWFSRNGVTPHRGRRFP